MARLVGLCCLTFKYVVKLNIILSPTNLYSILKFRLTIIDLGHSNITPVKKTTFEKLWQRSTNVLTSSLVTK